MNSLQLVSVQPDIEAAVKERQVFAMKEWLPLSQIHNHLEDPVWGRVWHEVAISMASEMCVPNRYGHLPPRKQKS